MHLVFGLKIGGEEDKTLIRWKSAKGPAQTIRAQRASFFVGMIRRRDCAKKYIFLLLVTLSRGHSITIRPVRAKKYIFLLLLTLSRGHSLAIITQLRQNCITKEVGRPTDELSETSISTSQDQGTKLKCFSFPIWPLFFSTLLNLNKTWFFDALRSNNQCFCGNFSSSVKVRGRNNKWNIHIFLES